MDEKELKVLGDDKQYWWFRAKNEFIEKEVTSTPILGNEILNIGPGTTKYWFAENYYGDACNMSDVQDDTYDAVLLLDVLEHIEDRKKALAEIYRVLKKNGFLFITVPAHQWLYNGHDKFLEHYLRYGKKGLVDDVCSVKFSCVKLRYWNSILFPFLVIWKLYLSGKGSDFKKLPNIMNRILYLLLKTENHIILPWGISIYGLFQKQLD